MTFKDLQDALLSEIAHVLKDVKTHTSDGREVSGLSSYANALPIMESAEDDMELLLPYFIVRIDSGRTSDDDDCWHVSSDIVIGVHDESPSGGHEHILVCIQRVVDRFTNDPRLGNFRADQEISWAVGEDEPYPYYFGGVSLTFSVPKIARRTYG